MNLVINSLLLFIALFLFSTENIHGQENLHRVFNINVYNDSLPLESPWVGGLFNPQFYQADIDFDNDNDIIIFDYQDNSILIYKNTFETSGFNNYVYFPDYADQFPELTNWCNIQDYNCDGISDLLTYNPVQGSIIQYVGYQNSDNLLSFTFQNNQLWTSKNDEISVLSFSQFDRPSFKDVDNDGDLDLLFFNNSDQVDFHSNQTIELYGHCDSLIFEFITDCWGEFDEGQSNFNLSITCDSLKHPSVSQHTGSSRILFFDYENDDDYDIIAGYGNNRILSFLTNGGTGDEALMSDLDSIYPYESTGINLPSFPAAYFLDLNNDAINELIVSSSFSGKAENNIWLYKNNNENEWPEWEFVKDNFLQDNMIDNGAYNNPTFTDYNLDDLPDLIISNRGIASGENANIYTSYLSLYENIGSLDSPAFKLIEKDWMGLSSLNFSHIKTTFEDLDSDGDKDLVLGEYFGNLYFMENIASVGESMSFDLNNILNLGLDVGYFSTPYLADIDKDGDFDIISGEAQGRVFYYKNTGTSAQFNFELESDFYGSIDVRPNNSNLGYSVPFLFNPSSDPDSSRILIVGNIEGKIISFKGVDEGYTNFEVTNPEFQIIDTGANASPTALYKNSTEGFIITGGIRGGLQLYEYANNLLLNTPYLNPPSDPELLKLKIYPNPLQNQQLNIEFPFKSKSIRGMIYITNSLGRITYSNPLNIQKEISKYSLSIKNNEISKGINNIVWISNDGNFQLSNYFLQ